MIKTYFVRFEPYESVVESEVDKRWAIKCNWSIKIYTDGTHLYQYSLWCVFTGIAYIIWYISICRWNIEFTFWHSIHNCPNQLCTTRVAELEGYNSYGQMDIFDIQFAVKWKTQTISYLCHRKSSRMDFVRKLWDFQRFSLKIKIHSKIFKLTMD